MSDRPALKVRRAMQALLVQLAQLDPPAPRAHRAALDLQALLDPQEPKVPRAKPAPKARPAAQGQPARKG